MKKKLDRQTYIKIGILFLNFFFILIVRKISYKNILLNYDEVEWIYCLQKMLQNPIPFKGFDSHTTGPLAIYLLSPFYIISKTLALSTLRIYGLIFLFSPFLLFFKKTLSEFIIWSTTYLCFLTLNNEDFLAYNTEWILIPLLFYIYDLIYSIINRPSRIKLFSIILLILVLPFIKFQAILYSLTFYTFLIFKLFARNRKKEIFISIIFSIFISFLFIFSISITTGFLDFKYYYLDRNIFYSKFMKWDKSTRDIFYIFRQQLTTLFYPFLFILFFIYALIFKIEGLKSIKKMNLEIFLLFISLLSIYLPKTNFTHYYQLLFFSFTILISNILIRIYVSTENKRNFSKIFITIGIFILIMNLNNKKNIQIINTDTYSKNILSNINNKEKVFIFGWFKAEPLYYDLRKKITIVNPSANTYFLKVFNGIEKGYFYNKELNIVLKTLNSNLDYIIDPEDEIAILKENKINLIISDNFTKISTFQNGWIYKNKKKWKR